MFNASYPFATLSVTPDALCLSCLGRDYRFPKGNIRSLSRHQGAISTGLRIEHTDPLAPKFVVFWASVFFWTSGFDKLKTQMEGLGYKVRA